MTLRTRLTVIVAVIVAGAVVCGAYAAQVSVYGVAYGLLVLLTGVMVFDRKEV